MNANLMMRAAELLTEARDLFDRSDAPPEYAAKLQEVIDLIESQSGTGKNFSRPAA